jgi:hypothetical protein
MLFEALQHADFLHHVSVACDVSGRLPGPPVEH